MIDISRKNQEKEETPSVQTTVLTWRQLLLRATALSLLFATILLLITAAGVGIFAYSKLNQFLHDSHLTFTQAKDLAKAGMASEPKQHNGKTTILVLGIDSVANKAGAPPLTDTILLLSINYQTGSIKAVSLPRDLWSEDYKTKINALYYYGEEKYPQEPQRFTREVISEMTGVPIDYTIVFSLSSISQLVDTLGGLEVDVPTGFIDTQFPREDVDVTATSDPTLLYETVEFKQGVQVMSAERVTQYIRSRHSQGDTGTDIDRAARQQLVISSLMKQTMQKDVVTNPHQLAQLYLWYQKNLDPFIPTVDAISMAKMLYPVRSNLVLQSNSLSIKDGESPGVITHPPVIQTDNQWSYTIVDKEAFAHEIQAELGL